MPRILRLSGEPIADSDRTLLSGAVRIGHLDGRHPSFQRLIEAGFAPVVVEDCLSDDFEVLVVPVDSTEEARRSAALGKLIWIVDRLLGPGGCPWDREQTHETLKRHLLEEAYEVLDAIDSGSMEALREELGDLILQPIMHAQMEHIEGNFDIADVADSINDKLIRRHPHVFGEVEAADSEAVLANWDRIKREEKGAVPASVLAGVPTGMASLLRAFEVSKRAARNGFEWPDIEAVFDKLREEETELREALDAGIPDRIEAEVGDLLFTAVNIARWAKVEPEEALRKMLNRFTERFLMMELEANRPLRELSPEEWDALWEASKKRLAGPAV